MTVIECGAGNSIATVRRQSEALQREGANLVRINPRESDGPPGTISVAAGALAAIQELAGQWARRF